MKLAEMNGLVIHELRRFPRGQRGSLKNVFRAVYQCMRMNSLSKNPKYANSANADRRAARKFMQKRFPASARALICPKKAGALALSARARGSVEEVDAWQS